MERVTAIILAGGRGKRMGILCRERPKPLLPFAGGFRVIDFTLTNCTRSQASRIAVLTDHQRTRMDNYLRQWHSRNSSLENMDIVEPRRGSYAGTANAVYQNLTYLQKYCVGAVLVLAADHVYAMDYRKMLAFHERMNADVTVGIVSVPAEQAYQFGVVKLDAENRIVDFTEKPRIPQSKLVSMGIYVFKTRILVERLVEDAAEVPSPHDFGRAVIPRMVKRDRVFGYRFDGYWQDIGSIETYYEANIKFTGALPPILFDSAWPVYTGENAGLPRKNFDQGNVRGSIVSPDCVIKGYIENSVLSPGVCVDEKAVVRNSVVMSRTLIGYHSVVDCSILGEAVDVGKFCYVGFGSSGRLAKKDITVLGKGATVPSYTAVGRNCRVLPDAGEADFITSVVPSGAVVGRG